VLSKWLVQPVSPGHGSTTREEFIAHLFFSKPCRRKQEWALGSVLRFVNGVLKHAYGARVVCAASGGRARVEAPYKIEGISELWTLENTEVKADNQTERRPLISSKPSASTLPLVWDLSGGTPESGVCILYGPPP
jgi:hypothetical protein